MEGHQRSFTDDYKRQAVNLDRICCQGAWAAQRSGRNRFSRPGYQGTPLLGLTGRHGPC